MLLVSDISEDCHILWLKCEGTTKWPKKVATETCLITEYLVWIHYWYGSGIRIGPFIFSLSYGPFGFLSWIGHIWFEFGWKETTSSRSIWACCCWENSATNKLPKTTNGILKTSLKITFEWFSNIIVMSTAWLISIKM